MARDYGQELEFGLFPTPGRPPRRPARARAARRGGRAGPGPIQDHPYQAKYLDTWTLLSVLGARTSTIRLAPNVTSLPLRPPVVLAKAAATLDLITGGRVELGLGAGAFWDAIVAAGGPRRTPREAVDALAEAVQILAFWARRVGPVRGRALPRGRAASRSGAGPRHPGLDRRLQAPDAAADGPARRRLGAEHGLRGPAGAGRMTAGRRGRRRRWPRTGRDQADLQHHGPFGTGSGFLQGRPQDWAEQLAGLALDLGTSASSSGPTTPTTYAGSRPRSRRRSGSRSGSAIRARRGADRRRAGTDRGGHPGGPGPRDLHGAGQHLVDVHDGLRAELTQIRDVLAQVRRGTSPSARRGRP